MEKKNSKKLDKFNKKWKTQGSSIEGVVLQTSITFPLYVFKDPQKTCELMDSYRQMAMDKFNEFENEALTLVD